MIDDKFAADLPRVKGIMVKYTPMKIAVAMAVIMATVFALASVRFVVPQILESPYDDGEISTNIKFCAGDERSRTFLISFDIDASATNTVVLAFGKDVDANGELDWQEIDCLARGLALRRVGLPRQARVPRVIRGGI